MIFLRLISHLLPRARAWQITLDTTMRQFFEGLTGLFSDVRDFYDARYEDVDPQTTSEIGLWEQQFGLPDTLTVLQDRRDRVETEWAATGGQSPQYIQDNIQASFPAVFLHEFWSARAEPSDNSPTVRDPSASGITSARAYACACGEPLAECGEPTAECGEVLVVTGFLLVNTNNGQFYIVPTDPEDFPYILYLGAATFPNLAVVDAARQFEFEQLVLRLCPGQQWLGVLVDYQ